MLGKMYFTDDNGYQLFLVFAPMLSSLTLITIKSYWPDIDQNIFDTNLKPAMSNLANSGVILKFTNSVLAQKILLHCIVTLFSIFT